jgi:hypothetical protein
VEQVVLAVVAQVATAQQDLTPQGLVVVVVVLELILQLVSQVGMVVQEL